MKFELKKLLYLSLVGLISATGFISCGDDDDDDGPVGPGNGGTGNFSAYVTGEGKTTNFRYGYVFYEYDDDYNGTWVEIEMCDIDLLYYYTHPSAIQSGQKVSAAYFEADYSGKGNFSSDSFTDYELECEIGVPIEGFMGDDDDFLTEAGYDVWNQDPIKFSKNGNNFSIEAKDITAKKSTDGDGWTSSSPDVKISFGLSGTPADGMSIWGDFWDDDYSTRAAGECMQFRVVTNPDEVAFLKKVRDRIRNRIK